MTEAKVATGPGWTRPGRVDLESHKGNDYLIPHYARSWKEFPSVGPATTKPESKAARSVALRCFAPNGPRR